MLKLRQQGFTLAELLVTVAVAAILFALAFPSFTTFLTNGKIKNTALAIQSGVQLARGEAIKRNAPVEFLLFNAPASYSADPTSPNYVAASTITDTIDANGYHGPNWLVRACANDPVTNDVSTHVDWYNGYEGSGRTPGSPSLTPISVSINNSGATSPCPNDASASAFPSNNVIYFNGLGGTKLASAATFDITAFDSDSNPRDACIANGGVIHCLRVTVSVAGQVKLCDPGIHDANDPRSC